MNNFDAWILGFQKACLEFKEKCIQLKNETHENTLSHLIDFSQKLSKEGLSLAPTLEIDKTDPNTDSPPLDAS